MLRKCENGHYTLSQEKCPVCGSRVRIAHPAKFSMDDKYWRYRYALKREAATK